MAKKMLIGMATFAILCAIASAGYSFGKHLATWNDGSTVQTPAPAPDSAT